MAYLDKVLQPGEKILHRGTVSWILYLPGALLFLVGVIGYTVLERTVRPEAWAYAFLLIFGAPGLYLIVRAWFERWITEIAIPTCASSTNVDSSSDTPSR